MIKYCQIFVSAYLVAVYIKDCCYIDTDGLLPAHRALFSCPRVRKVDFRLAHIESEQEEGAGPLESISPFGVHFSNTVVPILI